ncbi:MAG TPA: 6-hydroxymethylpterin diphosphokinase MptE-like protein [Steroidobacteraceae bacterium]|nr:6-hydroxymethylpterin diphosphokinase MptE-like protein [Steroidobacteraceae bacterium]
MSRQKAAHPLTSTAQPNKREAFARLQGYVAHLYHRSVELAWWITEEGRRNRARLAALRGRYQGRRCFVLGNGPSLRATDVRVLKNEVTIASNAIFLMFDYMGYKPTFLTVEDPLVAEDRSSMLNSIDGTTKIFPRDLAYCLPPGQNTLYINFVRRYRGFPRFSADLDKVCYWGGTVSVLNLQLAYFLGCNPVYLIGFDHSYKTPANLTSDVIVSKVDDVNHFHPDYFGKGFRWHDPLVDRMETAYRGAREFLNKRSVDVYNATAGGKLEVFPRKNFDDLIRSNAAP